MTRILRYAFGVAALLSLTVALLVTSDDAEAQSGLSWTKVQIDAIDRSNSEVDIDHGQLNNTLMVCQKTNTGVLFFKSSDLGSTWDSPVTVSSSESANSECSIDVATENHAIILWKTATTGLNAARTSNGGTSWATVTVDPTAGGNGGLSASVAYETPTHVVASHYHSGAALGSRIRFCESLDRGSTWSCAAISDTFQCTSLDTSEVFVEATDTYVIAASCTDFDFVALGAQRGISRYRSINGGTTFASTGVVRCRDETDLGVFDTQEPYECEAWWSVGGFAAIDDVQYALIARNSDGAEGEPLPPLNSHEEELWVYLATGGGNWTKIGNAFAEFCSGCDNALNAEDAVLAASTANGNLMAVRWGYGQTASGLDDLEETLSTNGGSIFGANEEIDAGPVRGCGTISFQNCMSSIALSNGAFSVFISANSGTFHYLSTDTTPGNFSFCCFTDAKDVRTDYDFIERAFVRDRGATGADATAHRFGANLTSHTAQPACPGAAFSPNTRLGLGVSIEPRLYLTCANGGLFGVQQLTENLGGVNYFNVGTVQPSVVDAFHERAVRLIGDSGSPGDTNFRIQSIDMRRLQGVWNDGYTSNPDGLGTDAWGQNRTATSEGTLGTRVYGNLGTLVVNDSGIDGTSADIHNNTVIVGDGTRVRKYTISGGTLVLADTNNAAPALLGTLRFSKDGRYIIAPHPTSGAVQVLDNATLDVIFTSTGVANLRAADIDVLNNHLFVVTKTSLVQFNIWHKTIGLGGDGDNATVPNPPPADGENPFDDELPGGGGGGGAGPAIPPGSLFDPTPIQDATGASSVASGAMLGILLVAGCAAIGYSAFNKSRMVAGILAAAGFGLATMLSLFPIWLPVLLAIAAFAIIIFIRRGSSGE